jgi:hypothetical protein
LPGACSPAASEPSPAERWESEFLVERFCARLCHDDNLRFAALFVPAARESVAEWHRVRRSADRTAGALHRAVADGLRCWGDAETLLCQARIVRDWYPYGGRGLMRSASRLRLRIQRQGGRIAAIRSFHIADDGAAAQNCPISWA